jgi:hypothetical protein
VGREENDCPFSEQAEIEVPLLDALVELGGEARPRDIYPLVANRFPHLTPEEQEEQLENCPSSVGLLVSVEGGQGERIETC